MGRKRYKIAKGLGDFVPVSVNFSSLEKEMDDNEVDFDPGDDGLQEHQIMDGIVYEESIVNILINLEPREKLVFVFQLLRDNGYQIDHASFAKVVKLSRRQYMRILDEVRLKTWLYVQGFNTRSTHMTGHKEG